MYSDYFDVLRMNEKDRDLFFLRKTFEFARDYSQDKDTQTGAMICDPDFRLVSFGSNRCNFGDPRRYEGRGERILFGRPEKYDALVHAESDSHFCASRFGNPVVGCTIYVTLVPCRPCGSVIINSGIKRCVTHDSTWEWYADALKEDSRVDWKESCENAVKNLKKSGIEYISLSEPVGGVEFMFYGKLRRP